MTIAGTRPSGRRVVVTGCGVVSAAGHELRSFWEALLRGRSFVTPLSTPAGFACPDVVDMRGAAVALPLEDVPPELEGDDPVRARCAVLALAAARRAVADAAGDHGAAAPLPERTRAGAGVVIGTTLGEERHVGDLAERGNPDASFLARVENHRLAALVARAHGLRGPALVTAAACSSGNAATACAFDLIAGGDADVMLAGGADTFTRSIFAGFTRMSALAKGACRPFDRDREGVVFGEGAAVLVLEELEHARARGARIHAELAGYGLSNDAHHITAPEASGAGVARAIRQALATSGVDAGDIDYVSAHGTGTHHNDLGEVMALESVLGSVERAEGRPVPVSSIKSMIGHTNGAASAIESVVCVLAMKHQRVPATANLDVVDPAFAEARALDFVRGEARSARVRTCLNLASGFGGSNVCVILREAP